MLKAKLDSVRKNKKGFSLVELIIVIAIMVALVAVMAPSFVKYVQKSRNSALASATESLYTATQTYFGDPDVTPALADGSTITFVCVAKGNAPLGIYGEDGCTTAITASTTGDAGEIIKLAGVDTSKNMGAATEAYKITATRTGVNYSFTMVKGTWDGSAASFAS